MALSFAVFPISLDLSAGFQNQKENEHQPKLTLRDKQAKNRSPPEHPKLPHTHILSSIPPTFLAYIPVTDGGWSLPALGWLEMPRSIPRPAPAQVPQ